MYPWIRDSFPFSLQAKGMVTSQLLLSPEFVLQTKVHQVKAMVFPVVMYGCESWTINKAERQRIDASVGEDS